MTYRATDRIYAAPGVLGYMPGDIVPDSAVENLGCKDKVAKEGTKAAKAAVEAAQAPPEPAEQA